MRHAPSKCAPLGFHQEGSMRCADSLAGSLRSSLASHLIITASFTAYFAVRAGGGFGMLDPSDTMVTKPCDQRSSDPPPSRS